MNRRQFLKTAIIGIPCTYMGLSLALPKSHLPKDYQVFHGLTDNESWFLKTPPKVVLNLPGIQVHDTLENNLFGGNQC